MTVDPTVTLELDGDIPVSVFADEMKNWSALISELSIEISRQVEIEWFIEDLAPGSARATARAESDDEEAVGHVVREYLEVARALEANRLIPYSPRLRRYAHALVRVVDVNSNVRAIRFQTSEDDVTIIARHASEAPRISQLRAYGAIEGKIQTLSSRKGLSFTLFDSLFDKAVTCYLREGQESLIEGKWNHRAIVEGLVSRDPITGRPVAIRSITAVTRLPETIDDDYRDARGVIPMLTDDERPEATIRRMRDDW